MAQEFHASFGLGASERLIHPVDANGITMAAVQALYARVVALERANESLREANRSLHLRERVAMHDEPLAAGATHARIGHRPSRE
jgi:hypothetical protein